MTKQRNEMYGKYLKISETKYTKEEGVSYNLKVGTEILLNGTQNEKGSYLIIDMDTLAQYCIAPEILAKHWKKVPMR